MTMPSIVEVSGAAQHRIDRERPRALRADSAFTGAGWAALPSDLTRHLAPRHAALAAWRARERRGRGRPVLCTQWLFDHDAAVARAPPPGSAGFGRVLCAAVAAHLSALLLNLGM